MTEQEDVDDEIRVIGFVWIIGTMVLGLVTFLVVWLVWG